MRARTTSAVALTVALATAGSAAAAGGGDYWLRTGTQFATAGTGEAPRAVSYDTDLVPPGAHITVTEYVVDGALTVEVSARGLVPGQTYGTHVHVAPCGADPEAAGGHYQNEPGSVDPENEVWLDFTADVDGAGSATSQHEWLFRPGEAASVVLHERATEPDGTAGDRVGCFTVPFAALATPGGE
ncbi:superoxide dismutase family protein [Streptomyces millisiae]|uniref:Superoxide dismutase family protein n=1 Tax=Streptomyces millisiae TaxID=3075542 RepID=A0ABU2LZM6_9ACTN|nr:superoxide dismutase family protein [Streptomyces sp. DSM 44918]MDT0322758.1 superoxide dismutase family protein [Streptomyces sp. DSM 44918]